VIAFGLVSSNGFELKVESSKAWHLRIVLSVNECHCGHWPLLLMGLYHDFGLGLPTKVGARQGKCLGKEAKLLQESNTLGPCVMIK